MKNADEGENFYNEDELKKIVKQSVQDSLDGLDEEENEDD